MDTFIKLLFLFSHIITLQCYIPRKHLNQKPIVVNETWTGKWFPHKPDFIVDIPQQVLDIGFADENPIKITSTFCDDGQTNLTIDWDNDPSDYICLSRDEKYLPNFSKPPVLELFGIPKAYQPASECMNVTIEYDEEIPTFGNHRALWPKYGEYQYIPRQRWLHTLEHGGIVMLYHPCANLYQVNKLRKLVKKCLYRYVITPSNLLPPELPMALVAWGKKLQMSFVDPQLVTDFIRSNALRGPEQISADGQFSFGLLLEANVVSDQNDSILCSE